MPTDFFNKIIKAKEKEEKKTYSFYISLQKKNNILLHGLDFQSSIFLSAYYKVDISSQEELNFYLLLWNYEALLSSLEYAHLNSSFYKKYLKEKNYQELSISLPSFLQENTTDNIKENIHKLQTIIKNILNTLPYTKPEDLALNSEKFLAISQDEIEGLISVNTSGTSSSNSTTIMTKRIYCSHEDITSTRDFFFYGMQNVLKEKENKIAVLMSGEREGSVGDLMKKAMDMLGVDCKIFGFSEEYQEVINKLEKYQPTCLIGIPSNILKLSYCAKNTKFKKSVKSILLSGDTANKNLQKKIEENLNCEVFLHYGMTEFGLGGAVECSQHKGMHIRSLDILIEIIDEKREQIEEGYGEIVITSLTREAMPLIRYRTGDIGRLIYGKCECNSLLPRLEILGRKQESFILGKNQEVYLYEIQDIIYKNLAISKLELSIFSDRNSQNSILILALEWPTTYELEARKKEIIKFTEEFIKLYKVELFSKENYVPTEEKNLKELNYFSILDIQKYNELISLFLSEKTEERTLDISLLTQRKPFPKKKITFLEGDFHTLMDYLC